MRRGWGLILAFLIAGHPASAILDTTIWQPGEVVDTQTDLSQFSFSVPHAVGPYAFFVKPRYARGAVDEKNLEFRDYEAGNSGFGMLQWQKLRIGVLTDFSAIKYSNVGAGFAGEATVMASYFWSWISLGLDVGVGRATFDQPKGEYMRRYGASLSVFGNKWAIESALRVYSAPNSTHYRGIDGVQLPTGLALMRWRYDLNYRWRFVLLSRYLLDFYKDEFSATATTRIRAGTVQFIAGSRYSQRTFESAARWLISTQVEIPLSLVLEHGSFLFYLGAVTHLWRNFDSSYFGKYAIWQLKLDPKLGFVWRITGTSALGVQFAQISYDNYRGTGYTELNASFQFTHNLAPFGYDDEVPDRDNLAAAR